MARARDCEICLLASLAKVVEKRWPDAKQLLADIDAELHALIEEELQARPDEYVQDHGRWHLVERMHRH